jgi:hypothetical protein
MLVHCNGEKQMFDLYASACFTAYHQQLICIGVTAVMNGCCGFCSHHTWTGTLMKNKER